LVFTPFSIIPYARLWPFCQAWAAHASYRSCLPSIRSVLEHRNFGSPDLIWTANPGSSVLKKQFPKARLVFQVVDYYPAFSGDSIRRIERTDYHNADHIFVIGHMLKDYITGEHGIDPDHVTVLGQGVFLERYQGQSVMPADLRGIRPPIGIWVGVLSKGDPGLFTAAAEALEVTGGSLVLIGPEAPWATALAQQYPNVHLIGPRSPEVVPDYLRHADLGLMLYDRTRQEVYVGQNPLKLYEYAAAGLPVLSTHHDEYRHLNPPVRTVMDSAEVRHAIPEMLANREALARASLDFVSKRSWQSIYRCAADIIEQLD
jgi:glycosyltransferase involved in cell wall biosynthesis